MQKPREVFRSPLLGIGGVVLIALALRAPLLAGGQIDYDEGVYWQSLRSLAAGHQLFAPVYSSQPPAFLLLLMPFYLLMGGTIVAARAGVLVIAVVGIAAGGRAVWLLAGPAAGILAAAFLAADPLLFRQSVTLQSDGPAVALALVAAAMAAEARGSSGRRAVLLAAGAGAAMAVAVLTKLLAMAAVPAVIVLLVQGMNGRVVLRPIALRLVGAAGAGCGLAVAVLLVPFIGVWSHLWAESVSFHLGARSAPVGGLDAQTYLRELPIVLLGAGGFLIALRRALALAVTGAVWTLTAVLELLVQHPLWPHHAAALVAPLALLSGAVAIPLTARAIGSAAAAAASAVVLLAASIASAAYVRSQQEPTAVVEPTVAALRATTAPGDLVISDDQFATALAGRSTPPELVDTSLVRVESGDLTVDEVIVVAQRWHVRAVLLRTERLSAVPGLRAWLDQHFAESIRLGTGRTLYFR